MKTIFQSVLAWLKMVFEEQKHPRQKNTIAVLDGVRGIAILLVISFHITYMTGEQVLNWRSSPLTMSILTAGGTGVTLFFVLSGFLLFMPYAKALLFAGRWPLARTFYLRRLLRIWPGYYFSLLVLVLLTQRAYLLPIGNFNPGQYLAFLVDGSQPLHAPNLANLGLFLTFLMDSSTQTFRQLDGPYWTLAVEWQFYVVLPVLALLLLFLVRRIPLRLRLPAVALCLVGIVVGGLLVRLGGLYVRDTPHATFLVSRPVLNVAEFFFFGRTGKYLEDFAVGMLASLCYIYAQSLAPEHRFVVGLRRLSLWLWGLGILILVFSAMWHFNSDKYAHGVWTLLNPLMPDYDWLSEMVLAWGYGLCILAILFGPPQLQRPFAWAPLRWIGLISYSLYIWHEPLLQMLQSILGFFPALPYYVSYTLYWLWVPLVIIPLCLCTYILIEKPGMKLGDRWRKAIEARYRAHIQAQQAPQSGEKPEEARAEVARSS